MLKVGADINAKDKYGDSVLHHVLDHGDCELACLLIKKGADYNAVNNKGETPATIAIEKGYEVVLDLMANIEVYTVGEEDPYEPEDGNRVYGSEDDYNDFDEEDETYDESREYHSPEEQLEMQRQREYEITLKAYGDIFGLEQGKILADLVTRMSEMNLKGLVADHMDEYMELLTSFKRS